MRFLKTTLVVVLALTVFQSVASAQTGFFSFAQSSFNAAVSQSNAVISVVLTGTPNVSVSVNFATQDGTGTGGVNFVATTGTLVFAVGVFTNTFTVPLLPNDIAQSTQTVNLVLSGPTAPASLGSLSNAVLRIINTATQAVQFAQAAFTVNQGESNTVLTIVRTGGATNAATVFFSTSDGSAKTGVDYSATSGTLTFTNGLTTNTVTIPILPGNALITNQTVNLSLSSPTGFALGFQSNAVLTIVATGPTVIQFSQPSYSFLRRAGKATLPVIRFGSSTNTATVDFATSDGTGVNGVDYIGVSNTLVFPPNVAVSNIVFAFVKSNMFQSNKTVNVTLSNPTGSSLGTQDTALVTIVNDKPQTVVFTNANGDVATLTLKYAGTMDVPPGNLPSNIVFSATDASSVLTVKVKKGTNGTGFVQIGGFSGDSDIRSIDARNVDLTGGGVQINGHLAQLQIHDILNGASITIAGGTNDLTSITAHVIDDGAAITTSNNIKSLSAARVGDAAINAPSIGKFSVKGDKRNGIAGDFNGQIALTGDGVPPGKSTLSSLKVSGAISHASIDIANGNLGSVAASQIIDSSIYVGFTPTDPNDPLAGGTFVPDLKVGSVSTKSTSNSYVNSVVAGAIVGKVKLKSVQTDNAGTSFGVLGDQSISSVTSKEPQFKWDDVSGPDQSADDFHVILP
jgi:hypothetical protein